MFAGAIGENGFSTKGVFVWQMRLRARQPLFSRFCPNPGNLVQWEK